RRLRVEYEVIHPLQVVTQGYRAEDQREVPGRVVLTALRGRGDLVGSHQGGVAATEVNQSGSELLDTGARAGRVVSHVLARAALLVGLDEDVHRVFLCGGALAVEIILASAFDG